MFFYTCDRAIYNTHPSAVYDCGCGCVRWDGINMTITSDYRIDVGLKVHCRSIFSILEPERRGILPMSFTGGARGRTLLRTNGAEKKGGESRGGAPPIIAHSQSTGESGARGASRRP